MSVAEGRVAGRIFPFSQPLIDVAVSQPLLRYALTDSGVAVPGSRPPKTRKIFAYNGAERLSIVLYYLTVVSLFDPFCAASDGTVVSRRALEHIRSVVAGGNEPGCSGNGLEAIGYLPFLHAVTIAKHRVPAVWNELSEDEKRKIDLVVQAALVGAHWCYSDLNEFDTGIDQTGNFGKEWNPNYRQAGVGAAIACALYFGPDRANGILKQFRYDDFLNETREAGLTNIATIFSQTDGRMLERHTRNDDERGFAYKGHPLSDLGLWLKEIHDRTFCLPASPVGGDRVPVSEEYPYGWRGYLVNGYDEFPNLGAAGMELEFDSSDAKGPRTSLSYVFQGWKSAIQNAYAAVLFPEAFAGLTDAMRSDLFVRMGVGTLDMIYKDEHGYNGYEKGEYKGTYSLAGYDGVAYELCRELWHRVIDNPLPAVEPVNRAANPDEMRRSLESPELALVLHGYRALDEAGKIGVAAAVLAARPPEGYPDKKAVQDTLYEAVKGEGLKRLNRASDAEEMKEALKSPALGLFLPEYDALSEEEKTVAARTLIALRPDGGYPVKREILAKTAMAVHDAKQPERGRLRNLPPVPFGVPRLAAADYDRWPANYGDAMVAMWEDDKTAAFSITIDDNYVEDHPAWLSLSAEFGVPLTWMAITGNNGWDPEAFAALLAAGHDVQSHTDRHIGTVNGRTDEDIEEDYLEAIRKINALPGGNAKTIAYPSGKGHFGIAARHYIAGRGVQGRPNPPGTVDYMHVSSFSTKWDTPADRFEAVVAAVLDPSREYYRGWVNIHSHGLNWDFLALKPADGTPFARFMLGMAAAKRDRLWLGTFTQIAMYAQERDSCRLTVTAREPGRIAFTLTDLMDDELFHYPLTVKVRIGDDWRGIAATQGGAPVPAAAVERESGRYALVKAVPDRGEVVVENKGYKSYK